MDSPENIFTVATLGQICLIMLMFSVLLWIVLKGQIKNTSKHTSTGISLKYYLLNIENWELLKLIYNINQKNKMIKSITVEIIEILELIDHHLAIPLLILSETRHISLYLVSPIPVMLFLYNLLPLLHFQGLEKCLDEDHFKVQERF